MKKLLVFLMVVATSPALAQAEFADDFDRPDGPADGWTVFQGAWNIADNRLHGASDGWVWAGDPLLFLDGDFDLSMELEFPTTPQDAVGRHGGIIFFAGSATTRNGNTGYTLDWIDRASDHGFRLIRWDGPDGLTFLVNGTPELVEPPLEWNVSVIGDEIVVTADGETVIEVSDNTHRQGHFGLWTYLNGSEILVDNLEIAFESPDVRACLAADPAFGLAPLTVEFDASCTFALGEIATYEWDFGDGETGSGVTVSHEYQFPDSYTVTMTATDAAGNSDSESLVVSVFDGAETFADDFERDDGPVDGWTATSGDWSIVGGALTTLTAGSEAWIWAGDGPVTLPGEIEISLGYTYLAAPLDALGRHGGIMFCAERPTRRTGNSGYTLDWFDQIGGLRLIRWDAGAVTVLATTTPDVVLEPPEEWKVTILGNAIVVSGDGDPVISVVDSTYRGGFFGVWAHSNNQEISVDNVAIGEPAADSLIVPCFAATPTAGEAPLTVNLDATCTSSRLEVTSYEWDFGDGEAGTGVQVSHEFLFGDNYTVTLTVTDADGVSKTTSRVINVFEVEEGFSDDFDRDDGPVDNWTVIQGDWSILDGRLTTEAFAEHWIWAGDPAVRLPGDFQSTFTFEFVVTPDDAVGRHAGVMFSASEIGIRWDAATTGYTLDWIDRALDHGFRLIRWDGAEFTVLVSGTPEIEEPPLEWRILVKGDDITVFGDGEEVLTFTDGTYRGGFFGFWAHSNGQNIAIDDFVLERPDDEPPPPPVDAFKRGDTNADADTNITDGIFVLNFLFNGGPTPTCMDAADANDDGDVNISDGVWILNFLFTGGGPPPPPLDECGEDSTADDLDCEEFRPCE